MKKLLISILACLPLIGFAQNTWEAPEEEETTTANPDQKYLAGAVPEVDGRVVFATTIEAPGKSASDVYQILLKQLNRMVKEKNQLEQTAIVVRDSVGFQLVAHFQEWLVFKNTALSLDRTRLYYNLSADCKDGKAEVKMTRIHYLYEEERNPESFTAEEWITDKYGLNKKKDKLSRFSGKFRRKTIDRKDYIFNKFESLLK